MQTSIKWYKISTQHHYHSSQAYYYFEQGSNSSQHLVNTPDMCLKSTTYSLVSANIHAIVSICIADCGVITGLWHLHVYIQMHTPPNLTAWQVFMVQIQHKACSDRVCTDVKSMHSYRRISSYVYIGNVSLLCTTVRESALRQCDTKHVHNCRLYFTLAYAAYSSYILHIRYATLLM
jgi:hypothetical protein